jgi:replication factor C large subunit
MDWAGKYRPRRLADLVGNTAAIRAMADWGRSWAPGKKPLLLYGKPGTGKTSSAHALAHDLGWEILELNASDQRTREVIERVAGVAGVTASLSGAARRLILFDEADNLHGTADRGGAREILEVIRTSRQPVILIANDLYAVPAEIRARCEPLLFRAVQARQMVPRLKFICASEALACSDAALVRIATLAGGDLRGAVNMLQGAASGRDRVTEEEIASSAKDDRLSIFDLVLSLFRGRDEAALLAGARAADEPPDTVLQWVEGNLDQLPEAGARALAYRWVSRADEYLGLTFRRQNYTLWRYATALMLLGPSLAAGGRGVQARLMPPARWRRIAGHRRQRAVRESILRKIGERAHVPQEALREDQLTLFSLLIEGDPVTHARDLSLDAEELTMLIHDRKKAEEVMEAAQRQEKQERGEQEKQERQRRREGRSREEEPPKEKEGEAGGEPAGAEPRPKSPGRKKPGRQSSLL